MTLNAYSGRKKCSKVVFHNDRRGDDGGSLAHRLCGGLTIRATANSNENDEDYDGLIVFKNYVESASNGAISVELFIGTQLCSNGTECLKGIADGTIDVVIQTSGGTAGLFPFVQVLDLPYLMADDRVANRFSPMAVSL